MEKHQKRIQYLDLLKAIAIFLVVFCHFVLLSETRAANWAMSACWMAVPVFFMVNGALLLARKKTLPDGASASFLKKHVKKTVSVYLVLAAWKLVYLLVIPPATALDLTGTSVWQVLNYLFLFGEIPGILNGHLWFIEALLAVYVVFPLFWVVWEQETGKPRRLTWTFAILALVCTNGFYSLGVLGKMLNSAGVPLGLSFDSLAAFQPFGKYGNMLGFFLLGALLAEKGEQEGTVPEGNAFRLQDGALMEQKTGCRVQQIRRRLFGAGMLAAGLASLVGVKWFLSGQQEWDGVLLQEGYRHVPVVFMAAGLFLLCRDVRLTPGWLDVFVTALSKRTLGIFYIHWIFGWLLVNPLAGWLFGHGISFGIGTNILKNIVLMVPAFAVTWLLEKLPLLKKLVTVG